MSRLRLALKDVRCKLCQRLCLGIVFILDVAEIAVVAHHILIARGILADELSAGEGNDASLGVERAFQPSVPKVEGQSLHIDIVAVEGHLNSADYVKSTIIIAPEAF